MQRFAKQVIATTSIAFLACLLTACNRGESNTATSGKDSAVAATVNGKNIMLSEVDRILSQQASGQQSQLSALQLATARMQVLNGLVQQEILFQRAEKEKLTPSEDEITREIATSKQQRRMTDEEYARFLRESNQTDQALRELARKEIAVRKLQEKVIGKISISDKEVDEYYNTNKASFVNARGVGLADIVVDPRDNGLGEDAKNEAEAKSKIDIIYQRLKSGADFATVAREKSEDPSNIRGGDIGFATEDQLKQTGFPPELVARFFTSMQAGDITPPIKFSNNNWYIFKLTSRQLQNENLTLESPGVRDQVKEILLNQRRELLNTALLSVAINEAKIENNLALNMLNSPSNLSGLRPAQTGGQATVPAAMNSNSAAATSNSSAGPAQTNAAPGG